MMTPESGIMLLIIWNNAKHSIAREGVIIEWPLNGQFHDRCDVILTSWMAVGIIFLTVAVI